MNRKIQRDGPLPLNRGLAMLDGPLREMELANWEYLDCFCLKWERDWILLWLYD
jgi:hypothetical protein